MEEKRRDFSSSSTLPPLPSEHPHTSDSVSTRRRAGSLKRKASAVLGSSGHGNAGSPSYSSPPPSKRATREKSSSATPHSQIQNGPLTRARQGGPGSQGCERLSAKEVAATVAVKAEEKRKAEAEEARKAAEALETAIEAEFERINSRSANVHVVPNHCGWFSWTKVHPLEEHSLPSFFNGKSQNRTPALYMDIRNLIVRKFHSNPNSQIELKELSDLEVVDSDARREVLEFLDYWGLINFHPFPASHSTGAENESKGSDKKDFLVEKLYQFEKIKPPPVASPSDSLSTQQVSSGLFSEALMADELSKSEGPSVEYHCNSCSADCSRKRYHCQKQADFDLCTECFNGVKFGSNMSSSDFILMEPADGPGAIGGKWTDQETLLLLEAIELFQDNWSEIAEHVATKTKAQCMLHFLQMPIEDVFFDCDDDADVNNENGDVSFPDNDATGTSDIPESTVNKTDTSQDEAEKSPVETSKPEDTCDQNADAQTSKQDAIEHKEVQENMDDAKEKDENVIVKTLKESFEAVNCSSIPDDCLSFSEAGNPVMALAEFFSQLVGSDFASAFIRGSLKSVGEGSAGIQLAMKHCFPLEDPPDQKEELNLSQSNFYKREEKQKVEISKSSKDDNDHSNGENGQCNTSPVLDEKGEDTEMSESRAEKAENLKDHGSDSLGQSSGLGLSTLKDVKDGGTSATSKDGTVLESTDPLPCKPNHVISRENAKGNGNDMECDLPTKVDKNMEPVPSNELKQPEKSVARKSSLLPDKSENVPNSLASEKSLQPTPVANEETDDSQLKVDDRNDSLVADSNYSIDKLKRAAASALSAAAVKAKLLADDEEDQIRRLTVFLTDKQLRKLEVKLAFFNDLDHMIARVREQFDRLRQRLYQERAQIIASRLGAHAASGPRGMLPSFSANRVAVSFANLGPRAATSLPSLRPLISRTINNVSPNPPNSFVSTSSARS